jgi:two-component system sensor histidine kinase DegS
MNQTSALDLSVLETVLSKTVAVVETSKYEIFDIAESARTESGHIQDELTAIKHEVARMINETDGLELKYKLAKKRLAEVSSQFQQYKEEDIRKAYEQASELQVMLSIARQNEKNLRERRDDLERRLKNLHKTIEKAENLMTQIGVVLGYLTGDLGSIHVALTSAHQGQQFGISIIQAQEEERKRVARDIHDGPAQSMAHVVLRTEIVEKLLQQSRMSEVVTELKELKQAIRNSLADVRKIIFDLRPMTLDDLGLVPTLRKYVEEFGKRCQLSAEFTLLGREQRLTSPLEVALFRLIQEALNNAEKHAQATQIQVKLEFHADKVTALIKDNGNGLAQTNSHEQQKFGLLGMQERIKLLNGQWNLQSAQGKGTRILITLPISQ